MEADFHWKESGSVQGHDKYLGSQAQTSVCVGAPLDSVQPSLEFRTPVLDIKWCRKHLA